MTKLYYDCPIEAAYMAKNFGVEFLVGGRSVIYDDDNQTPSGKQLRFWFCDEDGEIDEVCYAEDEDKIYVHPESLDIFKPIAKDIAVFKGEFDSIWGQVEFRGVDCRLKDWTCGEHHFSKIIQRNGKPFITPKKD